MDRRHIGRWVARALVTAASLGCTLSATRGAEAGQGAVVVTVGGETLIGEVLVLKKGEYVLIRLQSGEVRAIAWANLATMKDGVPSGTVLYPNPEIPSPAPVGGPSTTTTRTATAATSTSTETTPPAASSRPGAIVVPAGAFDSHASTPPTTTETPSESSSSSGPSPLVLAVRLGYMSPGGNLLKTTSVGGDTTAISSDRLIAGGASLQGDLGLRFLPGWAVYGFFEHLFLAKGSDTTASTSSSPSSNAAGIGVNWSSGSGSGVGFVLDFGIAYRWLVVPYHDANGDQALTLKGIEPLRIAFGFAIRVSKGVRLDLLGQYSSGSFSSFADTACTANCNTTINGDLQDSHSFAGAVAALRF